MSFCVHQSQSSGIQSWMASSWELVGRAKKTVEDRIQADIAYRIRRYEDISLPQISLNKRTLSILTNFPAAFPAAEVLSFVLTYCYLDINPQFIPVSYSAFRLANLAIAATFGTRLSYRNYKGIKNYCRAAILEYRMGDLRNRTQDEKQTVKDFIQILKSHARKEGGIQDIQKKFPLPERKLKDFLNSSSLRAADFLPLCNLFLTFSKSEKMLNWMLKILEVMLEKNETGESMLEEAQVKGKEEKAYYCLSRILLYSLFCDFDFDKIQELFPEKTREDFSKTADRVKQLKNEEDKLYELFLAVTSQNPAKDKNIDRLARSITEKADGNICISMAGSCIEAWHEKQNNSWKAWIGWDW